MKKVLVVLVLCLAGMISSCSVSEQPLTQNAAGVSSADSQSGDPAQALNVITGANQYCPSVAKDPSGNYIVVWLDTRNGVRDIYAHKLMPATFYTVWDDKKVNAASLTSNALTQNPKVACDTSGNIYVLYAQSSGNLRLRKLNANGVALWEVRADTAAYPTEWVNYDLAIDSSANVYVVYQRLAANGGGSYLSKFNTSGTLLWNNKNAGGIGNDPGIVVTGGYINIGSNGKLVRIDANGNVVWNKAVAAGKNRIANDASGNVYSALNYNYCIYYSKFNLSGTMTYGYVAIASGTSTYPKDSPEIAVNSSGDKFIVFRDKFVRTGGMVDTTVRGQKINSANTVLWTAGGVEVCRGDFAEQFTPDVVADGTGGLFGVWTDHYYYNTYFVWGNGINSSGVKYWTGDLLVSQPAWPPVSSSSSSVVSSSSSSVLSSSSSSKISSSSSSVVSSSSSSVSTGQKLVLYSETYAQSVVWPTDINTNESPSDPNLIEFTTATAGEGTHSFHIHVNSNMFNVNWLRYPLVTYLDLTAYKNGTLHFMVKATKFLSVSIHIVENYDIMVHLTNDGMYGFHTNNTWCSVVIPMSFWAGMDLTRLYGWLKFYGGYYEGIVGGEDYYIDNVYFQQ